MADASERADEEMKKLLPTLTKKDLIGHSKRVNTVAWNASGTRLASASHDSTLRVWSVSEKEPCQMELKGHTQSAQGLAWDPRGSDTLASVSFDGSIRLWDVSRAPGRALATLELAPNARLIDVAWSPDGETLLATDKTGTIRAVQRSAKGSATALVCVSTFSFASICKRELLDVAWHPSGRLVFCATSEGGLEVLHYPGFSRHTSLRTASSEVDNEALQFDPSGRYFALGCSEGHVSLWDAKEWACVRVFTSLSEPVHSLAFSNDSKLLAIGSEDAIIDISSVETGASLYQIPVDDKSPVTYSLAFHPKQAHLLAYTRHKEGTLHKEATIVVYGFKP